MPEHQVPQEPLETQVCLDSPEPLDQLEIPDPPENEERQEQLDQLDQSELLEFLDVMVNQVPVEPSDHKE